MTGADEKAAKVTAMFGRSDWKMLTKEIANAIDAAMTEERERCARIADKRADGVNGDEACEAACAIADEIRGIKRDEDES